ncbi:transposase DNA-binding-containing protein [Rhizorhapis sp. SPR117]|uniref:transposase DNA-binding-containing protein n=1 Tax=Rhizorhapis sp. SPR117 TaxID=2912611 RepID=UPI00403E3765
MPLACGDWAGTKAAYRFLSNDDVSGAQILAGHFAATAERIRAIDGPILVLQDATEFIFKEPLRRWKFGLRAASVANIAVARSLWSVNLANIVDFRSTSAGFWLFSEATPGSPGAVILRFRPISRA